MNYLQLFVVSVSFTVKVSRLPYTDNEFGRSRNDFVSGGWLPVLVSGPSRDPTDKNDGPALGRGIEWKPGVTILRVSGF